MKRDIGFLIVHGILILLLLGTLANAWVSPEIFSKLNILSLAFPYLLILHFVFLGIWLFINRKVGFIFLLCTVIFYNPMRRWINISPSKSISKNQKSDIKVVTFNVKYGDAGWNKVKNYLLKQEADLIFVQEKDTNRVLREGLVKYPCVILKTKHNILRQGNLLEDDENDNTGNSFFADVEINGRIIRVINVYLEPFRLNKNVLGMKDEYFGKTENNKIKTLFSKLLPTFKTHEAQVKKIREAIDQSPYPVIMAGDFNSVPNSWEYYNLGKNLNDAFVEAGNGSSTSFHDYKLPLRIDYIFSSKHLQPLSYKVDYSVKLSDHYPVIAEFLLN